MAPFRDADFLGTVYRHDYVAGIIQPRPESIPIGLPLFDEEYFEWIDLLESVVDARHSYNMMELGAGFGRWSVRAAFAVRQLHPEMPFHLTAVEAEPVVYGWMRQHFADNHLDLTAHCLLHAAVTEVPGEAMFYVGGPRGGPWDKRPEGWYGQCLTKDYDVAAGGRFDSDYHGFSVSRHPSGWRSIRVPGVSLCCLLAGTDLVDLIDMDIEGQELPSVQANIGALDAKVKRLHIGTHSQEIEAGLRELLCRHHWERRADYTLFSESNTPWGRIRFENGVQSWVNPRLASRPVGPVP